MALELMATPEPQIIAATHLDVENTIMTLSVPLTDVNGVPAGSGVITVRITKANLDGLTAQQKLNLRAVVVKLLQITGIMNP